MPKQQTKERHRESTTRFLACTSDLRAESIPSSIQECLTGKHKDGLFSSSSSLLLHSAKNSSGAVPASFDDPWAVAKKVDMEVLVFEVPLEQINT
jgi:hypothetical protein